MWYTLGMNIYVCDTCRNKILKVQNCLFLQSFNHEIILLRSIAYMLSDAENFIHII